MSAVPLDINASFDNHGEIVQAHGQVAVATTPGRLLSLSLLPENAPVRDEVLQAIAEAEWITMGPGSWFSSVLPHLLLPQLRDAIIQSPAKKILLLNLDSSSSSRDAGDAGEYAGYSPREHCEILASYAPELRFDLVVGDSHMSGKAELEKYLHERGSAFLEADLRDKDVTIHHDCEKLSSIFAHIAREMLV
jgi:uncharacterized cofD-like protein